MGLFVSPEVCCNGSGSGKQWSYLQQYILLTTRLMLQFFSLVGAVSALRREVLTRRCLNTQPERCLWCSMSEASVSRSFPDSITTCFFFSRDYFQQLSWLKKRVRESLRSLDARFIFEKRKNRSYVCGRSRADTYLVTSALRSRSRKPPWRRQALVDVA